MKRKKNQKCIVAESNCNTIGRNYNKMAFLSAAMKGKEVSIVDDENEYMPLCDELGVKNVRRVAKTQKRGCHAEEK